MAAESRSGRREPLGKRPQNYKGIHSRQAHPARAHPGACLQSGEALALNYDMMHVTPPLSALRDQAGWLGVDMHTLQHSKFPNVFSLGDCSSLPCSKTGAAVRKQAPVLVQNVTAFRAEKPLTARYEGYASCPLVTGYGKVILAEFGYDGVIMETFPFDQAKERYSMHELKAYGLPNMYWHGMLQGRG